MRKAVPMLTLTIAMMLAGRAWPQTISRSTEIHRPFDQVYAAMENYFSPDSMHNFQIVSRSRTKSKAELVATRTVTDQMKWSDWAYCKVPAMQMFDTLQQGNITVRVRIDRQSPARTYVTVTPDFQAQYALAGNSSTRQCTSKGVLEKDILRGAGAADSDLY